ncbi:initiation control protein YabA [Desulfotomaculum copahuensis]|uniref:initiation control protein YabA n=1 Tax=Desulfotomaculum copahuensis TaxID=1838280 RepID=UPI00098FF1E4|nr:initiation control protein YabA [Desulfotomaculum copahuensis]
METKIQELTTCVQKIKKEARVLTGENDRLRAQLARALGREEAAGDAEQRGGMETLRQLYEQGFHICNVHFGRPRTADCLFCSAFLNRERD